MTVWERYKTNKIRLCKDAQKQFGAMLVVLRNEFIAGATLDSDGTGEGLSGQVAGAAINYKKMIECLDRIITRLDCAWDITRLNHAYNILARAELMSADKQLSTKSLEEATDHYGTTGFNRGGDRIEGAGNDTLPDATGDINRRSHVGDSGSGGDDKEYEHEGSGGPRIDF